MLGNVSTTVT
jgi:hypothetical protein